MSRPANQHATDLHIETIRTPGLGDSTYVVSYQGTGLIVDPQRDVDRFLSRLPEPATRLRWVLETHVHNDYISGGMIAARQTGAELVMPAAAAPQYRHTPAFHLEDLGDSELTIRPIHTPGHTPEHTSYLILINGEPVALFSGGSLLVGSAGRPDLLGPDRADTLARLQYSSVRRIAQLPDDVGLYPTHGEGSFCTVSSVSRPTSTIGDERRANPVLAYADVDAFLEGELSALQPYPTYYRHMGPANLRGGSPIGDLDVPRLDPTTTSTLADSVTVVDMRDRHDFAAGHIPGSLGVELRDDFGTWVGWLVDIHQPIVFVADPDQDLGEAMIQLARIGYDEIQGVLMGLGQWVEDGFETLSHRTASIAEFAAAIGGGETLLDVRAPHEYEKKHVVGSLHTYVPDLLTTSLEGLEPGARVWVACSTGYRATIAAGILQRRGFHPVVLVSGGIADVCNDRWTEEFDLVCEQARTV